MKFHQIDQKTNFQERLHKHPEKQDKQLNLFIHSKSI